MSSYKDITTFSTPMLVKSLNTLQISAGEENGEWGSQFPQGVAIFVPEGEYFTVRIESFGAIPSDKKLVAMNAINATNDNLAWSSPVEWCICPF
ncbi:hypothetical protein [Corynebacterium accolens]|uniref:hypothetical protein n=1 Tax=Corynebacterium accolens TaxID=38284 RepID=UPI00254E19CD|nr:hypothetical protein [Corynebacterium accolens]MDK8499115.1 hypothetical protein [Corynebacterium accolens]MDK8593746.1 hypothetical protein [Corynebacterium accolens]